VIVGIVLRIVQWLANPSLWLDELMLVENLINRSVGELLMGALDRNQVASSGYLLAVRATIALFGDGELSLRLVSVSASVLALVLFWRLARALLSPGATFAATTGFALSPMLISLGSAVKPYSTDVLATVLILVALNALWSMERPLRTRVLIAAGAGAVGFLSIPSVLVAVPATAALLYRAWQTGGLRDADDRGATLAPIVVWALVAEAAALWARVSLPPETHDFMIRYWRTHEAFAPPFSEHPMWMLQRWADAILPGFLLREYVGAPGAFESALRSIIDFRWLVGLLVLLALPSMARARGPGWAAAVALPFVLAVIFSRLWIYPMDPRTAVFLLPLLLILVGALTMLVVGTLPPSPWLRRAIPMVAGLFFVTALAAQPPIYVAQPEREAIRELSLRRQSGEPLVAFSWAGPALEYYGPRFGIGGPLSFNDAGSPEDLSALRASIQGQPSVWVLFTLPYERSRSYLLCYLDELGRETERYVFEGAAPSSPASLHRYDLSDEDRVARVAADDFPDIYQAFQGDSPRCRMRTWSVDGG
jgi:4-amino-4-deoxy-L-arabinose transferase-like glycosyltransferase